MIRYSVHKGIALRVCFLSFNVNFSTSNSANPNPRNVLKQTMGLAKPNNSISHYQWIKENDENGVVQTRLIKLKIKEPFSLIKKSNQLKNRIISHFLPRGYPDSVSSGYMAFAQGQLLASIFSSAAGVLSMQSLLYAVGLGTGALPLAATLNWVIKDGLGQLGGVIFASLINNKFDSEPKKWRMISSISLEFSSFIEILTPLMPQFFLPLASIANVGKNISYLSASASRAAIHKSFAIEENLADVTAKSGSQSILAATIGTATGISTVAWIADDYALSLMAFGTLSICSLIAMKYSLSGVTINLLTQQRLQYLIYDYFHSQIKQSDDELCILSPKELNGRESFLFNLTVLSDVLSYPEILINSDLDSALTTHQDYERILKIFANEKYFISVARNSRSIHLLVQERAQGHDFIKGYILCCYLQWAIVDLPNDRIAESFPLEVLEELYQNVELNKKMNRFVNQLMDHDQRSNTEKQRNNSKWIISNNFLETNPKRIISNHDVSEDDRNDSL